MTKCGELSGHDTLDTRRVGAVYANLKEANKNAEYEIEDEGESDADEESSDEDEEPER